jgi:hypothetical protein
MTRFVAIAALVIGCGKKDEPESSGDAASADAASSSAAVPKDADSKAFAKAVLGNALHNFTPTNNGEMRFEYITLTFKADNSWLALARVGEGEDSVECKEGGTWMMEPAESATTASMEWRITSSDCPGRPKEGMLRTKVTIEGKEYKIQIR